MLAFARNTWAIDPAPPPGLVPASGRQPHQKGKQDPLQDQQKDPWNKGKTTTVHEGVKKTVRPQMFDMTPPRKGTGPPTLHPSARPPEAAPGPMGHLIDPPKERLLKAKKHEKGDLLGGVLWAPHESVSPTRPRV